MHFRSTDRKDGPTRCVSSTRTYLRTCFFKYWLWKNRPQKESFFLWIVVCSGLLHGMWILSFPSYDAPTPKRTSSLSVEKQLRTLPTKQALTRLKRPKTLSHVQNQTELKHTIAAPRSASKEHSKRLFPIQKSRWVQKIKSLHKDIGIVFSRSLSPPPSRPKTPLRPNKRYIKPVLKQQASTSHSVRAVKQRTPHIRNVYTTRSKRAKTRPKWNLYPLTYQRRHVAPLFSSPSQHNQAFIWPTTP